MKTLILLALSAIGLFAQPAVTVSPFFSGQSVNASVVTPAVSIYCSFTGAHGNPNMAYVCQSTGAGGNLPATSMNIQSLALPKVGQPPMTFEYLGAGYTPLMSVSIAGDPASAGICVTATLIVVAGEPVVQQKCGMFQ